MPYTAADHSEDSDCSTVCEKVFWLHLLTNWSRRELEAGQGMSSPSQPDFPAWTLVPPAVLCLPQGLASQHTCTFYLGFPESLQDSPGSRTLRQGRPFYPGDQGRRAGMALLGNRAAHPHLVKCAVSVHRGYCLWKSISLFSQVPAGPPLACHL